MIIVVAFILAPIIGILQLPLFIGQIIPPIVDTFALPFSFFFVMFGINIDDDKYEFDRENVEGDDFCDNRRDIEKSH